MRLTQFNSVFAFRVVRVLFFVLILIPFQNCGQITLQSVLNEQGSVEVSQTKATFLKAPTADSTIFRAAVMIDMSFSMKGDLCTDSEVDMLGAPEPGDRQSIGDCSRPSGVDLIMKRIKIVRKWIIETQEALSQRENYDPNKTLKFLLVPFSGAGAQVYLTAPISSSKFIEANRFVSYEAALRLLDKLEVVHNCYFASDTCSNPVADFAWGPGESSGFIGTSVPAPAITKMRDQLNIELTNLGAAKSQSRFEIVFLSDGVPKPRIDHVVKAAQIVWSDPNLSRKDCTQQCSLPYKLDLLNNTTLTGQYNNPCYSCMNILSSQSLLAGEDTEPESEDPTAYLGSFNYRLQRMWGDAKENEMINIYLKLKAIKDLFLAQNSSAQFRQSYIRIDAAEAPRKTLASSLRDETNWIERSRKAFSNNFRYALATTEEQPFGLFPSISSSDSYQLKHFVAVNLTTRVNAAGELFADSDADGLSDSEEVLITNTDPAVARSNGFCLDSIAFKMRGCVRVSCDPEVDQDGDGLNECDEKTIGTSDLDFDVDDDGIPDGLEILFGYNPAQNDRFRDANFDGKSNYSNFELGLPPMVNPSTVRSEYLNNIGVKYSGVKTITNANGQSVQVSGYAIQLHSLPLVFTSSKPAGEVLYKSLAKVPETKWPYSIVGAQHVAGNNLIYVLGKVENAQNPKDFYWIHRRLETPFGQPVKVDFDLELMDYLFVPDPQWSGL